jgi:hypothetical protein
MSINNIISKANAVHTGEVVGSIPTAPTTPKLLALRKAKPYPSGRAPRGIA